MEDGVHGGNSEPAAKRVELAEESVTDNAHFLSLPMGESLALVHHQRRRFAMPTDAQASALVTVIDILNSF